MAGESDQVNSPQFANDHRRFSQTGLERPACSTHSNIPSSPARPHRTGTRTGSPRASGAARGTEPLRDGVPQARTILRAHIAPKLFGFVSLIGAQKPSRPHMQEETVELPTERFSDVPGTLAESEVRLFALLMVTII